MLLKTATSDVTIPGQVQRRWRRGSPKGDQHQKGFCMQARIGGWSKSEIVVHLVQAFFLCGFLMHSKFRRFRAFYLSFNDFF